MRPTKVIFLICGCLILAGCDEGKHPTAQTTQEAKRPASETAQEVKSPITEMTYEQLLAAAITGNADAQVEVGLANAQGIGRAKDEYEAVRWFRSAAATGHMLGEFNLGVMYNTNRGVGEWRFNNVSNLAIAAYWYRKATARGHPEAQSNLNTITADSFSPDAERIKAISEKMLAADKGDRQAALDAGMEFYSRRGYVNYREAARWLTIAVPEKPAARDPLNDCVGRLRFARMFSSTNDPVDAFEYEQDLLVNIAAYKALGDNKGLADALTGLARLAKDRKDLGTACDYARRAVALFEELGDTAMVDEGRKFITKYSR